ncbi:MAG: TIGR03936 family radical SAM-associated protein [Clostridiaceae bacterium]|nr:TIGR03936 family radical SAM-associated protein [Clostridiaceae bacterium]
MFKVRIEFSKMGSAAYLSHLDLMKTLQRAFVRARLPVKYSQGFNPHIEMSLPVPLSTGYRSVCDLCDLELTTEEVPVDLLPQLNAVLPEGLKALRVGLASRPAREVRFCEYTLMLPGGDERAMAMVFQAPVPMEKRSKRGSREVDLRDYIRTLEFMRTDGHILCRCVLAAGEDPLNPLYIVRALRDRGLMDQEAAAVYTRTRLLDAEGALFWACSE